MFPSFQKVWFFSLLLALLGSGISAQSLVRIKDVVDIDAGTGQSLLGYGLVVGLNGSGDRVTGRGRSGHTIQSISNMLEHFGITVPYGELQTRNVAAVMVTAESPEYGIKGAKFDVNVASIGDARSLSGGILLMTPLKAADGEFYAMAQGPVLVGGYRFDTRARERVSKNFAAVGRVSTGGKLLEDLPESQLDISQPLKLFLKNPDFTTANRIAQAINQQLQNDASLNTRSQIARPISPAVISLALNEAVDSLHQAMSLLATIEGLTVTEDTEARVVINERTGVIVAGGQVRISEVMISHGNLNIHTRNAPIISQPGPFGNGQTAIANVTETTVEEGQQQAGVLPGSTTVGELADALNDLGISPRDLVSIFQAIEEAGALHAKLIVH